MGDWLILIAAIIIGFLIAVPFLIILINSFKSPADYNTSGPLTLPTQLYFQGIENFWTRVNFPEKLWNSFLISSVVAVLAVLLSVLNAFAHRHRAGARAASGSSSCSCWPTCCRRRRCSTRCTTCSSRSACTTTCGR